MSIALSTPSPPVLLVVAVLLLVLAAAGLHLVTWFSPAVILTAAVVLAPVSGNWQQIGVPGILAPDRLLLIAAIVRVAIGVRRGEFPLRLPVGPVHYVLAAAALYAVISATLAETIFNKADAIKLLEAFGILPFMVFALAPTVFRTRRDFDVLLTGLVLLGAYLGLTVFLESAGPKALVFPRYILDDSYGLHAGRGRGPFADAVANGFGLYVCAVAAAIATMRWSARYARSAAMAIMGICLLGTLLTLERSVWLGTVVGVVVTMLARRDLRRFVIPALVAGAAAVILALVAVPGLSGRTSERAADKGPIWDRANLTRAGFNMLEQRPVLGFGWGKFREESDPYFQISQDYPLTATGINLHNYLLTYAVELGIPGLILWMLAVGLAIVGGVSTRGPPEDAVWKSAFIAVAVFFLIGASFVPPTVFQNLCFWLFAGLAWTAREDVKAL